MLPLPPVEKFTCKSVESSSKPLATNCALTTFLSFKKFYEITHLHETLLGHKNVLSQKHHCLSCSSIGSPSHLQFLDSFAPILQQQKPLDVQPFPQNRLTSYLYY